jgi:hypothetical protein
VTLANKPPALIVPGIFISFDTTKTQSRSRRSKCLASRDPYSITSEREPPGLGSLHVDDQLDPRGLENPTGIDADLTVQIATIF